MTKRPITSEMLARVNPLWEGLAKANSIPPSTVLFERKSIERMRFLGATETFSEPDGGTKI